MTIYLPRWREAGIDNPIGAELHYRNRILAAYAVRYEKDKTYWVWVIPFLKLTGTCPTMAEARQVVEDEKPWEKI